MILAIRVRSGSLTWSLADAGPWSLRESRKSQTQAQLPRRATEASGFDNPTADSSCFPVPAVTPLAFDASAPSRPRSRAHPLRPLAICASARWPSRLSTVGLGTTVTPSRPQVVRLADCHSGAVPILSFPPPFLAGMAGWRHLLRPGGTALLCFPAARDPPGSGPSQKDWPSFALAEQRIFFDPPGKSEAWPGEQAPPAL
jgi:hypothetical protein